MIAKYIGVVLFALALAACGGVEDRKAEHLAKGKALFEEGNFEKARLEFKNVLKIDPKDAEARYQFGRVLEKLQDWRKAVGHYRGVVELDPTHVEARVRLGQIYLAGKAIDMAKEMADEAVKQQPDNPDVLALNCGVKVQQGDLDGALVDGLRAQEIAPGHVNSAAILAAIYSQKGMIEEAIAVLKKGIGGNSGNTTLRMLLAAIYTRNGQSEPAVALFEEIISLEPDNLTHRLRLASLHSAQGRQDEGESVLRAAITAIPDNTTAKLALVDFLGSRQGGKPAEKELLGFISADPEAHALRFGLAKLYMAMRDVEKAKQVYRDIIAAADGASPDGLKAKNRLAALLLAQNQADEASTLVAEILKENPRDFDALILKGITAMAEKDIAGAIADFRAVLRDRPNSAKASGLLAKAHLMNNEPELARETLQRGVEANPKDAKLHLELAQLQVKTGKADQAIQGLQEGLKAAPGDVGMLGALAKLQMAKKEWAAAQETIKQIKSVQPDKPLGYYLAGLVFQALKELERSTSEFELAVQKAPESAEPLSALVKSYLVQKQPERALARVEEIAAEIPKHFVAHNLRGEVLIVQRQPEQAEEAFQRAMELKPDWIIPYRNLAAARLIQGNSDGAVKVYLEGLQLAPNSVPLRTGLAALYERLQQTDLAIEQYEILLKANPSSQAVANNLAMLLAAYKQDQESLDRAMELTKSLKNSGNIAFLDTIGWVHYKRGEIDSALPVLKKAVEAAPKAPELNYHLGMAYYSKGDMEQARTYLQRATDGKRPFRGIKEAREIMQKIAGG